MVAVKLKYCLLVDVLNLAYKKPVNQSSTDGSFRASKAVNENLRDYSSTLANGTQWWNIDLLNNHSIKQVVLYKADIPGK